jgi:hypothetical protein
LAFRGVTIALRAAMALRVAILVQQIFWAVEIYIAVVAAQRVDG